MGGFNSRTREGCDERSKKMMISVKKFQFTHPRGVRLWSKPRNHDDDTAVSIHAPARGATTYKNAL